MHKHIKKTLETILIVISSVVLTNCRTQKQITETPITNPTTPQKIQQKDEYKILYKIFNIENQQPYKAELRDYRALINYIRHVEPEYRVAIENPEKFPEVLQKIDTNRNRIIEREEALSAYYSPHVKEKIKSLIKNNQAQSPEAQTSSTQSPSS